MARYEQSSSFFQNRACGSFPCHKGLDEDEFNCLLCYCPLYALGEKCGGRFRYSEHGTKVCTDCEIPHRGTSGVELVKKRFPELKELARKREA